MYFSMHGWAPPGCLFRFCQSSGAPAGSFHSVLVDGNRTQRPSERVLRLHIMENPVTVIIS